MREIARSQRFDNAVTLTFASDVSPEEASQEWGRMLRKHKPTRAPHYLRVAEWSPQQTNLHFHVLGDQAFVELVEKEWQAGFYRSVPIDFSSLDRACFYMGKTFSNPGRPYKRRFIASRGSKPLSHEFYTDDMETALEIARTVADTHSRYINEHVSDTAFGKYAEVSWDPSHFWQ